MSVSGKCWTANSLVPISNRRSVGFVVGCFRPETGSAVIYQGAFAARLDANIPKVEKASATNQRSGPRPPGSNGIYPGTKIVLINPKSPVQYEKQFRERLVSV